MSTIDSAAEVYKVAFNGGLSQGTRRFVQLCWRGGLLDGKVVYFTSVIIGAETAQRHLDAFNDAYKDECVGGGFVDIIPVEGGLRLRFYGHSAQFGPYRRDLMDSSKMLEILNLRYLPPIAPVVEVVLD